MFRQRSPSAADDRFPSAGDTTGGSNLSSGGESPLRGRLWIWILALVGGLLAGFASWGWSERTYNTYRPVFVQPPGWSKMNGYERADYRSADEQRQRPGLGLRNSLLVFGGLGFALGGALGLAGGLARQALGRGLVAGVVGALAGTLAAVGAVACAVPVFYRFVDPEMGIMPPAMTHLVIFGAIGAAAGMALGIGQGGRPVLARALVGGLAGGLFGALAYDVAAAMSFPDMRVFDPIPREAAERLPRLVMNLSAALLVSVLAVASIQPRRRSKPAPESLA
jgi:hypothetical protein